MSAVSPTPSGMGTRTAFSIVTFSSSLERRASLCRDSNVVCAGVTTMLPATTRQPPMNAADSVSYF